MAAPSISTYILSNSSHYYGSEGGAAVMTSPSDSVTKVSAIISQTSGGAAIETVETTVKTSSDLYADRWALTWPTSGIASSPYYVRMWATNSDGDGAVREVAPYIFFPPSVSVTSPANGSTLTDSSVTMAWSASDDYGISYQRASVSHDGTELWGAEVEGNSIAVPSSIVFEDGESYSFSVMARNGKGMESTATNTASFSFVAPSVPALVIAEGDGKSASITVTDSSYTESGTVLEASSAMMESLTIHGLSVQDGTPTPSAPVAIESVQSRNLWGGTAIRDSVLAAVPSETDGSNGYGQYVTVTASNFSVGKTICAYPFKASTQYTLILTLGKSNTSSATNIAVEYTDGGLSHITFPTAPTSDGAPQTFVYVTAASKTVRRIIGGNWSGMTYVYYGECGLFEGVTALSDFTQYGAIDLRSIGKNLLEIPTTTFTSEVGITWTAGGGSVSLSGTDTGSPHAKNYIIDGRGLTRLGNYPNYANLTAGYARKLSAGTYTLSATFSAAAGSRVGIAACVGATIGAVATSINIVTNMTVASVTFSVAEGDYVQFSVFYEGESQNATISDIQLEIGSPATAYEPYSSTTTPIPVTLRSLPDGTHDEWISGESADTLIQRVGETMQAVTDGVTGTVGVDVLSSTGEIANGAQVIYKLATPVTTTLAHVNLPYVDGSAWVDAEVTPQIEATFRPVDFPDQPAADSVDVVRVNADGSTWTVASNLTMGDTVTDPLPPLGVDAVYKAVGKTSAGGMSEKLYMHGIPSTGWVLNFGDAAQETVGFIYNPQATMTLAQGGESYHFADGGMGGGFPVFYPTTDRDASGTLAFDTVLYGDSDRLLDLCRRYPVAWLRDPFGHRWRAHVRPSVSHGVGQVWPVTIAWDAVRFEEV